ncbi:MAG: tetratricopeptide repeat protein [Crocinitomicaceae bacterium]
MREFIKEKFFLTLTVITFFHSNSSAQSKHDIDSLKTVLESHNSDSTAADALAELCWNYMYINKDTAILYGNKAISLSNKLNDSDNLAKAYSYLSQVYNLAGQYEAAIYYVEKTISFDRLNHNYEELAKDYVNLANIHQEKGDYDKSIEIYFKTLAYFETKEDYYGVSVINLNIANTFGYQQEYERAMKFYKKAYNHAQAIQDKNLQAYALNGIGICATGVGDFKTAKKYHIEAKNIFEDSENYYGQADVLANLGFTFQEEGKIDTATSFFKEALALQVQTQDVLGQLVSHLNLGACYNSVDKYTKAIEHYERVINIAKENKLKVELSQAYQGIALVYKDLNQYKKAYEYQKLYTVWRDSIITEERVNTIESLSIQYELKNKEKTISQLNAQKKLTVIKAEHARMFLWLLIGFFLIIFSFIIIVAIQLRNKAKRKQIELEHAALRAQMNPHFIFNSLNSVQRLYVEGNTSLANDYIADFSTLLRKILENSSNEKIILKEELDMLQKYFELEVLRSNKGFEYEIIVDPKIDLHNFHLPPLIIQPFVENAIWHGILPKGNDGKVVVQLSLINPKLIKCTVEDNGVGWNTEQNKPHKSKGIGLTEQRLRTKVKIIHKDPGTKIEFTIKKA